MIYADIVSGQYLYQLMLKAAIAVLDRDTDNL